MPPAIQFDPDRGEVRIGGAAFACVVAPGGVPVVNGHHVHPITLGERDRIVAFTVGDTNRAMHVARLIGAAATRSSIGGEPEDDVRAALEAAALHLAGAGLPGSLARTTLLMTRAIGGSGDAVAALPAADADRLAAALTPAVAGGESSEDNGWTTISYYPTSAAVEPKGPAAARDHLAALLLARDRPVGGELAVTLLDGHRRFGDEPPERSRGTTPTVDGAPTFADEDRLPSEAAASATDRWTRAPSPSPTAACAGRWAPPERAAVGVGSTLSPHRDTGGPHPGAVPAPGDRAQTAGIGPPRRSSPAPAAPDPRRLPAGIEPISRQAPPQRASVDPGPAAQPRPSTVAPAANDPRNGRSSNAGSAAAPPMGLAWRPARAADPFDEPGPSSPAPRVDGARSARQRDGGGSSTPDPGLDALATALHLAADLRGVR